MAVEEFTPPVNDGFSEPKSVGSNEEVNSCIQASVANENKSSGILCTPAVRNLAKQHGINVNDIKGSGIDGRILKEDILSYVRSTEPSSLPDCSDISVSENSLYGDTTLQIR